MDPATDLDETDLALVSALQSHPRASWTQVGHVLGISPVTAARRWTRLRAEGIAWVSAYPNPAVPTIACTAYVEVRCTPSAVLTVAAQLAQVPTVISLTVVTGGSNLLLTVAVKDESALAALMLERIPQLAGITGTRTHLATNTFVEGSRWQLGERTTQRETRHEPLAVPERELLVALGEDGRRSYAELAEITGTSTASVRRRLSRLLGSGAVSMRCELARDCSGWPVKATYRARVAPDRLEWTGQVIAGMSQVRLCSVTTGSENLLISALLRSSADIHRFEAKLVQAVEGLQVVDNIVALRQPKWIGRLLDERGRAIGFVPLRIWDEVQFSHEGRRM